MVNKLEFQLRYLYSDIFISLLQPKYPLLLSEKKPNFQIHLQDLDSLGFVISVNWCVLNTETEMKRWRDEKTEMIVPR